MQAKVIYQIANINKISKTSTELMSVGNLITDIKSIVAQSRQQAYAAVNQAMVLAYWNIGKRIVEEEQQGKERADYGKQLLKQVSAALTEEFGKGFSVQNLYYFRQFYLTFPEIFHTACGEFSTTQVLTPSNSRGLGKMQFVLQQKS